MELTDLFLLVLLMPIAHLAGLRSYIACRSLDPINELAVKHNERNYYTGLQNRGLLPSGDFLTAKGHKVWERTYLHAYIGDVKDFRNGDPGLWERLWEGWLRKC